MRSCSKLDQKRRCDRTNMQVENDSKIQFKGNEELHKIFREGNLLSILEHKNIVHYCQSWIEFSSDSSESSSDTQGSISHGQSLSTHLYSWTRSPISPSSDSCSPVKCDLSFQKMILYIQMDLCTSDLAKWLVGRINITAAGKQSEMYRDNIRIFKEILEGTQCIHEKGIIHRDLKPANIFLSGPELTVKIGDFGLARYAKVELPEQTHASGGGSTGHTPYVGTVFYSAPEINTGNYDFKVDMYSLGIILFEMFQIGTEKEIEDKIKYLKRQSECPDHFQNKKVAAVVCKLIMKDPNLRPSAKEILTEILVAEATSMSYAAGSDSS